MDSLAETSALEKRGNRCRRQCQPRQGRGAHGRGSGRRGLVTVGDGAESFSDICLISVRRAWPVSSGGANGASTTLRTEDRTVEAEEGTDSLVETSALEIEATGVGAGVARRWRVEACEEVLARFALRPRSAAGRAISGHYSVQIGNVSG